MSDEVFDRDKAKWYKVKRGFFGRLILQEQIYTQVTKFPTRNQLSYSDCKGLYTMKFPGIPEHLRPSEQTARDET